MIQTTHTHRPPWQCQTRHPSPQLPASIRLGLTQLGLGLAIALMATGVSAISPQPSLRLGLGAAQAQTSGGTFSDQQVRSYAAAVLTIDSSRESALAAVRTMLEEEGLSTNQVDLSCTSIRSLNRLPNSIRADVRETMVGFCNQAGDIVTDSGLSVEQFNAMTAAHQSNPQLAERIAAAITQIKTEQQR
ncbi:hypothetical protein C7271_15775 [filamentous cyanobacterium CCP5]|nr:hypothetical protein C7271_15775 [filamentous cyanobacterium CCP5]